ncbi:MAG: hypothetical protein KDE19_07570 [Caldilineaceae bacterium]|nr:hypothetical protein [Caldilineaceae bacterium]
MPPFTPNAQTSRAQTSRAQTDSAQSASNTAASDELTPSLTALTLRGPAARQQAFIQERLAGADRPLGAAAAATTSPRAVTTPPTPPTGSLATERQQQLADFRTRQLAQVTEQVAMQEASPELTAGALATMSRDLAATSEEQIQPDFLETNRWLLLGPSLIRDGQSGQQAAMSGRVRGIAVAPGGERLYIATANGGVWRSEDGGQSWLSLMDAFDLNPSFYRADSLACGALALVPGDWAGADIIYVGSGEPGVSPWFQGDSAYFGVGPIVSIDGGINWITEASEPSLAGSAFYALAVDPVRPQRVVAATLEGLYRRELAANGTVRWFRKKEGYFCSVVVSHRNSTTTFYAAEWGGSVWQSHDGEEWIPLGTEWPDVSVGRIGLAVQPDHPDVLYALVADVNGHLLGLYRLDRIEERWRPVQNIPPTLFGPFLDQWGQGGYDLAIAVDPLDVNHLYIGGSTVFSDGIRPLTGEGEGEWSGALYRCELAIDPASQAVSAEATYIGGAIHGDIHAIQHAPGDANRLWVGCDGGLFFSADPTGDPNAASHVDGLFGSCNTGLSTVTMNHLGMHPTEEAVLFCGTQDNGGLRYTGDPVWLYSSGGDSGYFAINWHNPYQVATTYIQNQIFRSEDGGMRYSYAAIHVLPAAGEEAEFYAPLAGTPYAPDQPATATRLAFGGSRVWLSERFGGEGLWWDGSHWRGEVDWVSLPNNDPATDRVEGKVEALTFAAADKLYAATSAGRIYRYDYTDGQWQRVRLPAIANEEVAAFVGPVTAVAVDTAVANGNAIYVTLGGMENPHRVWYFDGVQWAPRSGRQAVATASQQSLLNVQHNAIVVDPRQPTHLYVAADIGVWRSVDAGHSWTVFARGLPDAAVVDLKLHEHSRLLRAATHGRGVYEFDLGRPQRMVDLYIRDHLLDLGRHPAVTGLPDPTAPGATVVPGQSPDIRLDPPDSEGRYQFAGAHPRHRTPFHLAALPKRGANGGTTSGSLAGEPVDFGTFATKLTNDTGTIVTHSHLNVQTQVYVQVHNRGRQTANSVRVMLLLATIAPPATETGQGTEPLELPPLPTGYEAHIDAGRPITSEEWQTIGITMLHGIRASHPQVATFVVNAEELPTPGRLRPNNRYALVAFVQSADDPFRAEAEATLTPAHNRHVAHRLVRIEPFTGSHPAGTWRRRRQSSDG